MEFIRYVLLSLGLTYIGSQSVIAGPVRVFLASRMSIFGMLYCPSCLGFWVGMLLGALHYWPWALWWAPLEAAIASCALGALWMEYGTTPSASLEAEMLEVAKAMNHAPTTTEESDE